MIEGVSYKYKQAGFIQAVYIEVCFLSHAGWLGRERLQFLDIQGLYSGLIDRNGK